MSKKITTVYTLERIDIEEAILAAFKAKYEELQDENEGELVFYTAGSHIISGNFKASITVEEDKP